jgi:DNA polymerase (family X)
VVSNAEVAARLQEIADLLDLLGERFKPEAYRRAGRSLESLPESLEAIAARHELRSIPGVGEAIAEKVGEILRTGSIAYLERLRSGVPNGVLELMRLNGIGPKTARRFWVDLGIEGPAELLAAIDAGRLAGVKGFADRKIAQLKAAVQAERGAGTPMRLPIEEVWPVAHALLAALRESGHVAESALAGSFRRCRETVGDLDILVTSESPESVFDAFSRFPLVREVRLRGPTKETVVLRQGLQVDLRVVAPESFGAALQYFTGSKDHNVRLRSLARERGLKINEYGVYRGDERLGGRTEEEVYRLLGLAYIPPELREDRGEIAAAAAGPPPALVEAKDLRTELHVHLSGSPEPTTLARLRESARARRVGEVGVVVATVDASPPDPSLLREAVRALSAPAAEPPRLLPAAEAVAPFSEEVARALTEAGIAYLIVRPSAGPPPPEAPRVRAIGHATGPSERAAPVLELARALGAAIEVGPGAERFDSTVGRLAREAGVALALPTGVGAPEDDPTGAVALGFARRAGASRAEVANSRPLADVQGAGPERRSPTERPVRRGRRRP